MAIAEPNAATRASWTLSSLKTRTQRATEYAGGTSRTVPSRDRAFDPADGLGNFDLQSMFNRNSTGSPYQPRSPSAGAGPSTSYRQASRWCGERAVGSVLARAARQPRTGRPAAGAAGPGDGARGAGAGDGRGDGAVAGGAVGGGPTDCGGCGRSRSVGGRRRPVPPRRRRARTRPRPGIGSRLDRGTFAALVRVSDRAHRGFLGRPNLPAAQFSPTLSRPDSTGSRSASVPAGAPRPTLLPRAGERPQSAPRLRTPAPRPRRSIVTRQRAR